MLTPRVYIYSLTLWILLSTVPAARAQDGGSVDTERPSKVDARAKGGIEFTSNPRHTEGPARGGDEAEPGVRMVLQPGLAYLHRTPSLVFETGGDVSMKRYFGEALSSLNRYSDAEGFVAASALPSSWVGFSFDDNVYNVGWATEASSWNNSYVTRFSNDGRAKLSIQPQAVLGVDLGGMLEFDSFSNSDDLEPWRNNRMRYGPSLTLNWRFLPLTRVEVSASREWTSWAANSIDTYGTSGLDAGIGVPDSSAQRITAGLIGQTTRRLKVNLVAGHGRAIYDESTVATGSGDYGADLTGFVPGLLLTVGGDYLLTEHQTLKLSYSRDFDDAWFTNFVAFSQVAGSWKAAIWDSGEVDLGGRYRYERYEGSVSRLDNALLLQTSLSWKLSPIVDLSAWASWTARRSADGLHVDVSYDDVVTGIGLTAHNPSGWR